VELMRRAVRAGADVIGGGPLDDDYRAHIAQGFELARELGVPVDIHADLPIDRLRPLPEWEAPLIAAHARASGLAGRVAIGHFASSSALTAEQTRVIAAGLAEAGVHLAALPASEMYRQGLSDPVNSRRGVPRVRELLDAGVNVAFASNNIRDAFVTFGDADMLEQALLGALAAHLDDWDTVLDMVTSRPAALMGLAHRNGVEIGMDADLVLLDARSAEEAIGAQVEKLYVIRRGRIVVRNERTTSGAGRA
jgi:cytosine deaminase